MAVYKCPNCNEIIESLRFSEPQTAFGTYYLPDPNRIDRVSRTNIITGNWESEDTESVNGEITYKCPHCDHELDLEEIILDTSTPNPNRNNAFNVSRRPIDPTEIDNIPVTNVGTEFDDNVGQNRLNPDYADYVKCKKCNRVILAGATDRIDSACPHCGTELKTPCGNAQNVARR